jgi:AcrR family transcriptional regulator
MNDVRHKNKEDFRRKILASARELFSSDGYGNFSMRKLARRIGYSPTTIYLYFRDKDDLLFCLSEELFSELGKALQQLTEEGAGPLEILRGALLMYVEFCLANPEHYRVAFFTSPVIYGSPQEYLERDTMSRRAYFQYRDLVTECCAVGALRPMDPDLLAQVLWSGMHGVVAAAIYTQDFPLVAPGLLAETMVEGLLHGFRK